MADRPASRVPGIVRGSVVVHRRRCGKPNCRCAGGEALHESTLLSYSEQGRTRFVMLPAGEVAAVQAAVDRYRAEKDRLEERAEAGLSELVGRLGAARRQA
jgi:hypothetical protein